MSPEWRSAFDWLSEWRFGIVYLGFIFGFIVTGAALIAAVTAAIMAIQ